MSPKIALTLTSVLVAIAMPAMIGHAASRAKPVARQPDELKIVVPFALPIGVPVATLAPYFYSTNQLQTSVVGQVSNLPSMVQIPDAQTTSPRISTRCAACHSGQSPKGNLLLDQPNSLSAPDRFRAIRAVAAGQMPKGSKLTNAEIRTIIDELANLPDPEPQASKLPTHASH